MIRHTNSAPDTWTPAAAVAIFAVCAMADPVIADEPADRVRALAQEVRDRGWIVFSARSTQGDYDLFACRPDGSQRRALTATPEFSEILPRISPDGHRLLYRRLPKDEVPHNNHHGTQGELVVANADGSGVRVLGVAGALPWASESPDGRQIATLARDGISFVDVGDGKSLRRFPRQGFFQQLTWSPDGHWLCGVANSFDTSWSIACMSATGGPPSAVNRIDCCTPDWFPDSQRIVFSWRPPGRPENGGQGWTQLWMANRDGTGRRLLYAEDGRHVYGGHVSPDGLYVLFTGNMQEDGDPANAGAPMGLMRIADAPIVGGGSASLRAMHPGAGAGPVLVLPSGWEPCWTRVEWPAPGARSTP